MKLHRLTLASALALAFTAFSPGVALADPVTATFAAISTWVASSAAATFIVKTVVQATLAWGVNKAASRLGGNKSAVQERQASVTSLALGEVPREMGVGVFCTGGSLIDPFNFGGKYGTDTATRIIALVDHEVDGIVGYYVDDAYYPWTGDGVQPGFNGKLSIEFKNARADGWDAPLHVRQNGGWDLNDRLIGVTHVVVDTRTDDEVWSQGHPKLKFVLRGLKVYDPRKDPSLGYTGPDPQTWADPATHRFSQNAAVLAYNFRRGVYVTGRHGQLEHLLFGRGLTAEEAPPSRIIAAANVCDEMVDGVARYMANGVISAAQTFVEVEAMFEAAMAGVIVQREGGIEIEPGHAKAAAFTITDAVLVNGEARSFSAFLPNTEGGRINTVIPRYVEPALGWKDHGGPVRRDLADIAKDRRPLETTLPLMLVTNADQAGRCAEIMRRLARLERRATIVLPPEYAETEEGDVLAWQSDRYHDGATVRYRVESWSLDEKWRQHLTLREIASSVFGVPDPIEDRAEPPPPPTPIDALTLAAVTVEAITLAGETTAMPAIRFRWDVSTLDTAMTAIRAEVRRVGETEVAPTRTEMVNAGEMIVTNGVGPQMELQGRLVPIGDPSRPVAASPWVTVSTSAVVADVPPEVIQAIEDILVDVDAIQDSVGEVVEEVGEVRQMAASSTGALNNQPTFAQAWADGTIPPGWADWSAGAINTRAPGADSANAVEYDIPADTDRGLLQTHFHSSKLGKVGPGYFVVEFTVELLSGALNGSGVLVDFKTAAGVTTGAAVLNPVLDDASGVVPGSGVVGQVYRFAKLVRTTNADVRQIDIYSMAGWSGFGSGNLAKKIRIHRTAIRPATAGEVEAGQARGGFPSVSSRMSNEELVRASETAALAMRASLLEAKATVLPNLLPNSDYSQLFRSWTPGPGWATYYDGAFGSIAGHRGGTHGDWDYLSSYGISVHADHAYSLSFAGDGGVNPGQAHIYLTQYDANGAYIAAGDGLGLMDFHGVSWTARKGSSFVTRPDCATVVVNMRKVATPGLNVFASRIMLNAGATAVGWNDGATARELSARVQASEGAIATHDGRLQAWAQKRVVAGSAETFVEMNAIDDNGVLTADINMGARRIGMFNPVDGGWIPAFEAVGGEVRVARKLYIGAGAGQFSFEAATQRQEIRNEFGQLKVELGKLS